MLKGIDVSHFSNITLSQLKSMVAVNRLYFNFIKATEGATIQDQKFATNWEMSRSAGLICGAYHFFRPLTDVDMQVMNFITQYKKVSRTGVMPPVIDIEWAKSGSSGTEQWQQLAPADRVPAIMKFLTAVESEIKVKPMIYTAPAFWKQFIEPNSSASDSQQFSAYPLWVVDLKNTGSLPAPWKTAGANFIQNHFGENATTSAPFDHLDQNGFNGSSKDLLNMTAPGFTIMKGFPFSFLVMDLQNKLITLGNLAGAADGLFGTNTEDAVKDFQKVNGFFENGIVDSQTWNKLL